MINTILLILILAGVLVLIYLLNLKNRDEFKTEIRLIRKHGKDTIHFSKLFNGSIPKSKIIQIFDDKIEVSSYLIDPIQKVILIEASDTKNEWTHQEWKSFVSDGWTVENIYTFYVSIKA